MNIPIFVSDSVRFYLGVENLIPGKTYRVSYKVTTEGAGAVHVTELCIVDEEKKLQPVERRIRPWDRKKWWVR